MSDNVFSNFQITPIKNPKGKLVASGWVTVANAVSVRFAVFEGKNGVWAKLPVQRGTKKNEKGFPIEYPEVKIGEDDLFRAFQNQVKSEYNSVMGANQTTQSPVGEEVQTDTPATPVDDIPF